VSNSYRFRLSLFDVFSMRYSDILNAFIFRIHVITEELLLVANDVGCQLCRMLTGRRVAGNDY
jgi:hypothetical protein